MDNNFYCPPPRDKHVRSFEIAALVLSIIAIATCCCFYIALPCGALAVIFASLSRGGEKHMTPMAKVSLIVGIIAIVVTLALVIYSLVYCMQNFSSIEDLLHYYSDTTGIDYDTLYESIYGN